MNITTLCYINKNDKYLMLHRVSKKNDVNKDKWIGVGGHFEEGESPEECLFREVYEETGLTLKKFRFRGFITFVSDEYGTEYMALYTGNIDDSTDTKDVPLCDEGVLEWLTMDEILSLNLWEGDRIFFRLLRDRKDFFSLKLEYQGEVLKNAVLDGNEMELFDIRDEEGNKTGVVRERNLAHECGDLHGTVHIWVYRETEGKREILLQKRSNDKDSFPGCYDISSAGHMKAGDEYDESALRELEEELGIKAEMCELVPIGFHRGTSKSVFWGRKFINSEISKIYLYRLKDNDIITLQKEEIQDIMWISVDDCIRKIKENDFKHCLFMDELEILKEKIG